MKKNLSFYPVPLLSKKTLCLSIGLALSQNAFSLTTIDLLDQYYQYSIDGLQKSVSVSLERVSDIEKKLKKEASESIEGLGFDYYEFDENDEHSVEKMADNLNKYASVSNAFIKVKEYLDTLGAVRDIISIKEGYDKIKEFSKDIIGSEFIQSISERDYTKAVKSLGNLFTLDNDMIVELSPVLKKGGKIDYINLIGNAFIATLNTASTLYAINKKKNQLIDKPKEIAKEISEKIPKELTNVINTFSSVKGNSISERYRKPFLSQAISIAAEKLKSLYNTSNGQKIYAQELVIKNLKANGVTDQQLSKQIIKTADYKDSWFFGGWRFHDDRYGNIMAKSYMMKKSINAHTAADDYEKYRKQREEEERSKEQAKKRVEYINKINAENIKRINEIKKQKEHSQSYHLGNNPLAPPDNKYLYSSSFDTIRFTKLLKEFENTPTHQEFENTPTHQEFENTPTHQEFENTPIHQEFENTITHLSTDNINTAQHKIEHNISNHIEKIDDIEKRIHSLTNMRDLFKRQYEGYKNKIDDAVAQHNIDRDIIKIAQLADGVLTAAKDTDRRIARLVQEYSQLTQNKAGSPYTPMPPLPVINVTDLQKNWQNKKVTI